MHIQMPGGPLKCSKCGSTNAVKPLNSRDVAARCADCGHTKLTREGEQREFERKHPRDKFKSYTLDKDHENTF